MPILLVLIDRARLDMDSALQFIYFDFCLKKKRSKKNLISKKYGTKIRNLTPSRSLAVFGRNLGSNQENFEKIILGVTTEDRSTPIRSFKLMYGIFENKVYFFRFFSKKN